MSTDHDRLFKLLIHNFFEEFMLLFFPEAYEQIDFTHVKFLSEELFTDLIEGDRYQVDILVETKLKTDEEGIILVHIEPQSYYQPKFNERMFIYFSRLYEKYHKKILPIAIFSYDKIHDEPDRFEMNFPFLKVLNFRYGIVELKKKDWRKYLNQNNPVAAALLSKMGYSESERVKVKLEFLRMITKLQLDPAKTEFLFQFFEIYLRLNNEEEKELKQELSKLNPQEEAEVMEYMVSYERKGFEKGLNEGRELEKKEMVKNMLEEGLDLSLIAKVTGLSIDEIKKIQMELK